MNNEGSVTKVFQSIVIVGGLGGATLDDFVNFERGETGFVIGVSQDGVEVILFETENVRVGDKVWIRGNKLSISPSESMRGGVFNSNQVLSMVGTGEARRVDGNPLKILNRKNIDKPLTTGILLIDLIIPLAKGQRELILGDRNTGKTSFLFESVVNQAKNGTLCIYVMVGKKSSSIKRMADKLLNADLGDNLIMINSSSSDSSGLNFITPFLAMTVAEYFKDRGVDVMVVIDDLSTHANYYREISLLARRFPGRNSYPGDIFYVHSRLLERAGGFKEATITCLPVAETTLGDLSGYIQTNLMAMTDGHIFFDKNLFDQGHYPSINPFLSVTRVGLQAQLDVFKDISRTMSGFLVRLGKIREFMHFGSELSDDVKKAIAMGGLLDEFFSQKELKRVEPVFGAFMLSAIWGGFWVENTPLSLKHDMIKMYTKYKNKPQYKYKIDSLVLSETTFLGLTDRVRINDKLVHVSRK